MMLLFCKKTTSCSILFFPFCVEEPFFFSENKEDLFSFRLKKVKKSTTWLFRNRRLGEKEKKRLDEISVLTTLHKVNARAF